MSITALHFANITHSKRCLPTIMKGESLDFLANLSA